VNYFHTITFYILQGEAGAPGSKGEAGAKGEAVSINLIYLI